MALLPQRRFGGVAASVAGAMLVGGCFFVGQNISYRSLLLILALPGLSVLSTETPTRPGRAAIGIVHWLADESLWWWIMGVLGSAVIAFVSTSSVAEALFAGPGGSRALRRLRRAI